MTTATGIDPASIRTAVQTVTEVRESVRRAENGQLAAAAVVTSARESLAKLDDILGQVRGLGLTGDLNRAVTIAREVREDIANISRQLGGRYAAVGADDITREARRIGARLDEALRLAQNAQVTPAAGGAAAPAGAGTPVAVVVKGEVMTGVLQDVNGTKLVVVS